MNPGDGAVPCIEFFSPPSAAADDASGLTAAATHMFSGSADGSISVGRLGGE